MRYKVCISASYRDGNDAYRGLLMATPATGAPTTFYRTPLQLLTFLIYLNPLRISGYARHVLLRRRTAMQSIAVMSSMLHVPGC